MTVSFAPLRLTPPSGVTTLTTAVGAALESVGQTVSAGVSGLGGLGLPSLPSLPGLPGTPPSATALRESLTTALEQQAQCLMVSPYQYGVGNRLGEAAWLTPAQAIKQAAQSLGALTVSDLIGDTALVLVLSAAVDQSAMAQALGDLNTAFPLPDLQKLQRRARAVADLEQTKFTIPAAPAFPPWGQCVPRKLPVARQCSRALSALVAQAEGREAAAVDPAAVLAQFAQRQTQSVQSLRQELSDVAASLSQTTTLSGWFGLYVDGAAAVGARLLAQLAPPLDERFKCATALAWYGSKDHVAYYKELFGL